MNNSILVITKADNGYIVEIKEDIDDDSAPIMVFETKESMLKFIDENIDLEYGH